MLVSKKTIRKSKLRLVQKEEGDTLRDAEIQIEKCFQYFERLERSDGKRCVTVELLVESGNKLRVKDRSTN